MLIILSGGAMEIYYQLAPSKNIPLWHARVGSNDTYILTKGIIQVNKDLSENTHLLHTLHIVFFSHGTHAIWTFSTAMCTCFCAEQAILSARAMCLLTTISCLTLAPNHSKQMIRCIFGVHFDGVNHFSMKRPSPFCWVELIPIPHPTANLQKHSQRVVLCGAISRWKSFYTCSSATVVNAGFLNIRILKLPMPSPEIPL